MNASKPAVTPILYSVEQAALRLNISTKLVRAMINRGELRSVRLGRILRIHESEIRRLCGDAAAIDDRAGSAS